MNIDTLLHELSIKTGLPNIKLNSAQVCRLVFDGTLTIDIESESDEKTVHIHTVIGKLPDSGQKTLFYKMLTANAFGNGTNGAVLSIDETMDEILMFSTLNVENMIYSQFEDRLECFIRTAEIWRAIVSDTPTQKSASDDTMHRVTPNALFV